MLYKLKDIQKSLNIGSFVGLRPVIDFLKELGYDVPEDLSRFRLTDIQYHQIIDNFSQNINSNCEPIKRYYNYVINVGDVILIPNEFVINRRVSDDGNIELYVYVLVKCADGNVRSYNFYPKILCKKVNPIIDNCKGSRVITTGTASELCSTVDTVEEGLQLIKGKMILVSKIDEHTEYNAKKKECFTTNIYQFDLIDSLGAICDHIYSLGEIIHLSKKVYYNYDINKKELSPYFLFGASRFFPNKLCEAISPFENGVKQCPTYALGSAVDLFKQANSFEEGLDRLRGNSICVTKMKSTSVINSSSKKRIYHIAYQYDLVPNDVFSVVRGNDVHLFKQLSPNCAISFNKENTLSGRFGEYMSFALELAKTYSQFHSMFVDDWSFLCRNTSIPDELFCYGVIEKESVVLLTKDNMSFFIYDMIKNEKVTTVFIPLLGKAVDFYTDVVDDYEGQRYAQAIVLSDNNEYGVIDSFGHTMIPFMEHKISYVYPKDLGSNAELYFYLVERKGYNAIYYKDRIAVENFRKVQLHTYNQHIYLSVLFKCGWQVFDCTDWIIEKEKAPLKLFRKNICMKYEPVPFTINTVPFTINKSQPLIGVCGDNAGETKFGFVDIEGKLMIPCIYNDIYMGFENGIARVAIDNNGSYINIDSKNTICGWGNINRDKEYEEKQRYYDTNVGDWSFADDELEDFKDNWDPN